MHDAEKIAAMPIDKGGNFTAESLILPFQKRFILEVYDNPAGTTEGILSIARKNGKSARGR